MSLQELVKLWDICCLSNKKQKNPFAHGCVQTASTSHWVSWLGPELPVCMRLSLHIPWTKQGWKEKKMWCYNAQFLKPHIVLSDLQTHLSAPSIDDSHLVRTTDFLDVGKLARNLADWNELKSACKQVCWICFPIEKYSFVFSMWTIVQDTSARLVRCHADL